MKNLLTITDLSRKQIEEILELSASLQNEPRDLLKGKNILFAFEKPSLRTKVGTEVAINHLGGNVIHIDPKNFFEGKILFSDKSKNNIDGRESLKDTVKNVCNWCDAIFARVFSHQTLLDIDSFSTIPTVNALCDKHHPMQALADLLTIQEIFGKDKKISLAFVGDANNVAFSLFEILLKFGHDVRFGGPEKYFFSQENQDYLQKLAQENSGKILFTKSAEEAVKGVDIVYADTFVSMGEEDSFDEKMKHFSGYQINKELFSHTNDGAYFMHCLPAHRGIEVTDEIIDSENSLVYKQAKNRMVVSSGVFAKLLA